MKGVAYKIQQRIMISSSPSAILDGIERYFNKRGRILHFDRPSKERWNAGMLALERQVAVELIGQRNRQVESGRLDFRWFPAGETAPSFVGSFEVQPQGRETELALTGDYQPPFETVVPEFGAVFPYETAQGTGRLLLEELKAVLETETDAITEFDRSQHEELQQVGTIPQVGWKTGREHFW